MSVKINLSPGGFNEGHRTGSGAGTDFGNTLKKLINPDNRKVDVSSLPVTYTVPGSRAGGWFMIAFSLVWGGVPTAIFLSEMGQGPIDPEMYMLLIFSAIGLGLLIGGLYTVTRREAITLDSQTVTLDKKSIFGHTLWSEPLSRYKGVRARTEYHSGGKNQSSYKLHIVELYHIDKKKRIKLYESKNPGSFRSVFEEYSRQLNMPALEGEDGQLIKRDAADLDKSVRELAQEGKLKVDFDPRKAPPRGVMAHMKGERLSITIPPSPMDAGGMFIGFIFVLVFGFIGFFVEEAP